MITLTEVFAMDNAPPLVCANCGKSPAEHNVSASERLVCRRPARGEWEYTKERRAFDIAGRLRVLATQDRALREELYGLTGHLS